MKTMVTKIELFLMIEFEASYHGWDSEETNGVRISVRGKNLGISEKRGETRVSFMLKAESCIHMFGLFTGKGMDNRASL